MYHHLEMNTKSSTTKFVVEYLSGIDQIGSSTWNNITGTRYPFLRHEFLGALENSGSVSADTGWQPHHVVVYQEQEPAAVMPLYIKTDSYGEFVFDWAWADAYQRHGYEYYPKLLTAIPFTPATGPRLSVIEESLRPSIVALIINSLRELTTHKGYSSWHLLFPEKRELKVLESQGLSLRTGCQYHWFNQDYTSFDDFLGKLSSRKRKNIKRERRRVAEQGIQLRRINGPEVSEQQLSDFYTFYQATYYKRARRGYLTLGFFQEILQKMPEQLVLIMAYHNQQAVAAALCFQGNDTLYGRYWGCLEEFECLHFEACYYQGIEYCIEQKLHKFDPGAQGEHKISRGFEPVNTWSLHWIEHPDFRAAIDDFLEREAQGIDLYMTQAAQLLPFKKQ